MTSSFKTTLCLATVRMLAGFDTLQFLAFFVPLGLLCGALASIDIRLGIIPDGLNLAIAGLGLVKAMVAGGLAAGTEAALAAAAIGVIFWLLQRLYFVWRKIDGLGLGDVKFLAAAATWVGFAGTPMLLLIAAVTALIAAGGLRWAGQTMTRQTSLPFGPFLAMGLLLALLAQQWLGTA
jgi:leader peptidase (prepilin peptidase) / N-methyltransferase